MLALKASASSSRGKLSDEDHREGLFDDRRRAVRPTKTRTVTPAPSEAGQQAE